MKRSCFLLSAFIIFSCIFLSFTPLTSYDLSHNEIKESVDKEDNAEVDRKKLTAMIKGNNPITWVFTGNSITQGAKHTHGMRAYPEIFAERIRFEMGRSRDFVINTAISGNTTKNILNDFDRRITQLQPQVVSLMIGTNDAATGHHISTTEFEKNLTLLITKIRSVGAIPIILSPNTIITEKAPERGRLNEYIVVISDVVKKEKVIFVDNYSNWNNELKTKYNQEVNRLLLNDPLHPNGLGHKEIAFRIFKELSIFNPADPTCGGDYYEGEH